MNEKDKIHSNHRERMREKYNKFGADVFATHELLEMLLYFSVPRSDTNPTAHNLLDLCMTPDTLLRLDSKDLAKAEGAGEKSALLLKLSGDFSRRCLEDSLAGVPFDTDFRRRLYLYLWYKGKAAGTVAAMYLTKRNSFCGMITLSEGRMFRPESYISPLLDGGKKCGGTKVIISHNHVNNVREASVEDLYLTEYIRNSLADSKLELCGHYVVTDTDCTPVENYKSDERAKQDEGN